MSAMDLAAVVAVGPVAGCGRRAHRGGRLPGPDPARAPGARGGHPDRGAPGTGRGHGCGRRRPARGRPGRRASSTPPRRSRRGSTAPRGSPTSPCPSRSSRPRRWPAAPGGRRSGCGARRADGCSSGRSGSALGAATGLGSSWWVQRRVREAAAQLPARVQREVTGAARRRVGDVRGGRVRGAGRDGRARSRAPGAGRDDCRAPGGRRTAVIECRECGLQLSDGARFCRACGTPVTGEQPATGGPKPDPDGGYWAAVGRAGADREVRPSAATVGRPATPTTGVPGRPRPPRRRRHRRPGGRAAWSRPSWPPSPSSRPRPSPATS